MDLEHQYSGANQLFDMAAIVAACSKVKEDYLNAKERFFLRAAACSAAIRQAADFLGLKLESAQAFISQTIKRYVKEVIKARGLTQTLCHGNKMAWSELPYIFEKLGYKRSQTSVDRDWLHLLEEPSSAPCEYHAGRIIPELHEALEKAKFEGAKPTWPLKLVQYAEENIIKFVGDAQKYPDASDKARRAYLESIGYSYPLLLDDPIGQIGQGVKIAQNLSKIRRYADSAPLALELVRHVRTREEKSKLNFVVGMALEQLAKHFWNDGFRRLSIDYYQASIDWEETKNCVALYNIFDLNFRFLLTVDEGHKYMKQTRLALRHFVEVVNTSSSNFDGKDLKPKTKLQAALKAKRSQTDDVELLKDIDIILGK